MIHGGFRFSVFLALEIAMGVIITQRPWHGRFQCASNTLCCHATRAFVIDCVLVSSIAIFEQRAKSWEVLYMYTQYWSRMLETALSFRRTHPTAQSISLTRVLSVCRILQSRPVGKHPIIIRVVSKSTPVLPKKVFIVTFNRSSYYSERTCASGQATKFICVD